MSRDSVVTIRLAEAPTVIRDSVRAVLAAREFVVMQTCGERAVTLLDPEELDNLLLESGNNAAQTLLLIDVSEP